MPITSSRRCILPELACTETQGNSTALSFKLLLGISETTERPPAEYYRDYDRGWHRGWEHRGNRVIIIKWYRHAGTTKEKWPLNRAIFAAD